MLGLIRGLVAVLLVATLVHADEAADAKEKIRQVLEERFRKLERVHAAYGFTAHPDQSGVVELFRQGSVYGLHARLTSQEGHSERWCACDGALLVVIDNGEVTFADWGPQIRSRGLQRLRPELARLCRAWGVSVPSVADTQVYFDVKRSAGSDSAWGIDAGIHLVFDAPASWLWRDRFSSHAMNIDEGRDRVILRTNESNVEIERSTGLLLSARGSDSAGHEVEITRGEPELGPDTWPQVIRAVLASPDAAQRLRLKGRLVRVSLVFEMLMAIVRESTEVFDDALRLADAAEALLSVTLNSDGASEDVASIIEEDRVLSPSIELVRSTVVDAWVQPMESLMRVRRSVWW